jgi:hypothetical protein
MDNTFEIKSGKAVLSDPCYDLDVWCMGIIDKVKNGKWVADTYHVNSWGRRVAVLSAHHIDHKLDPLEIQEEGELLPFDGGVDSGQFGYFDFDGYRKDETILGVERIAKDPQHIICADEPWYSMCCDRTLTGDNWGVLPLGVVSSTGYGDGSYPTYGIKNAEGEYVGFTTIFIAEDDGLASDDEEEEDEDTGNMGYPDDDK